MKAVLPVAGLGTRFLPATKAQPKELLPILDRPCIDYVVAERSADVPAIERKTSVLQNDLWAQVRMIAQQRKDPITASMVAAMNEVIDLSLLQRFAFTNRVPVFLLWAVLGGSVLSIGAMEFHFGVTGYRQLILTALLLIMWTGAIVSIVDLNRPRVGQVRVDPTPLIWTLEGFGQGPK